MSTISPQEQVSLLSSSLEVLHELVDNYLHSHHIAPPEVPPCHSSETLQDLFNSIYSKVKHVLDCCHPNASDLSSVSSVSSVLNDSVSLQRGEDE